MDPRLDLCNGSQTSAYLTLVMDPIPDFGNGSHPDLSNGSRPDRSDDPRPDLCNGSQTWNK